MATVEKNIETSHNNEIVLGENVDSHKAVEPCVSHLLHYTTEAVERNLVLKRVPPAEKGFVFCLLSESTAALHRLWFNDRFAVFTEERTEAIAYAFKKANTSLGGKFAYLISIHCVTLL